MVEERLKNLDVKYSVHGWWFFCAFFIAKLRIRHSFLAYDTLLRLGGTMVQWSSASGP